MRTRRILAIGNSLAENPLKFLRQIAESSCACQFEVAYATIGGCQLVKHWNLAENSLRHPEQKNYQLDTGGAAWGAPGVREVNLREALLDRDWDQITLNHASAPGPWRETWEPWIGNLVGLVRELAPRTDLYLNMTWAYREDSPYLIDNGLTSETMFERLRNNYRHFAELYGCGLIPTGEAIQAWRRSHPFHYPDPDFDYRHAVFPDLPSQESSISVGWFWNVNDTIDGIPVLTLDPNHLNLAGLYLAGATWYQALTAEDVRVTSFAPFGLDSDVARELRELAHRTCSRPS